MTTIELTRQEKVRYLCTNMKYLSRDARIAVARIPWDRGFKEKMKEVTEGVKIYFDGITDESVIHAMYQSMKYHVDKAK